MRTVVVQLECEVPDEVSDDTVVAAVSKFIDIGYDDRSELAEDEEDNMQDAAKEAAEFISIDFGEPYIVSPTT